MFLDGADGYSKLRRCGLVTQALETHEHESGPCAMRHARKSGQGDRSLLLGLQNPIRRQVVDRVVNRLQLTMRLTMTHGVPAPAIKQHVSRRLEDEAVQVGYRLAAAPAVQAKQHLLNEIVDVVVRNPTAEKGAQRLLVMQ